MGLNIVNIIMEIKDETDNDLIGKIKEYFPLFNVKTFSTVFNGIIGQADVKQICAEIDDDEKSEEILDAIFIEDKLIDFSKIYPNKIFGYIEMDCSGGICLYEGFVVKNGGKIIKQECEHEGHINILKKINKNYDGYFFEPFTREFINRK
jgi:hypothetical protein